MESFKILNEKVNPLFNRKEIQVSVESKISPKKQEIKDLLSEKLSVPKENIKVKKISGNFGSGTFSISANVYSSKKDKEFLEKEKKPENTGEVSPEEKPAEELNRENKPEQTKESKEQ